MRLSMILMVFAYWTTPCAIAAEQTRCIVISGTADALGKNNAVEKSLKSLREAIDKWKTDNNVTGPVSETPEKPTPNPYWRGSVSPRLLLPPDVVSDSAYTICWTGVVSPVVRSAALPVNYWRSYQNGKNRERCPAHCLGG